MKLNVPKIVKEFTSRKINENEDDSIVLNYFDSYKYYDNFCLIRKTESYRNREYDRDNNCYVHGERTTHIEFSCSVGAEELKLINADYIEVEIPSSIKIGISDLPDITRIVPTTSQYGDGSGKIIPTPKIITENPRGRGKMTGEVEKQRLIFFTHNVDTTARKIGGTPQSVSDFLLSLVSQYEAQKEEEDEKRREEKEHERLENLRRLESTKKETLAEIERVKSELDSLKKRVIDAKAYHDIPNVLDWIYPEGD